MSDKTRLCSWEISFVDCCGLISHRIRIFSTWFRFRGGSGTYCWSDSVAGCPHFGFK